MGVHVCAVLDKVLPHKVCVSLCREPAQRNIVILMHDCAVLAEKLINSGVAIRRCQRFIGKGVHVRTVLEEHPHNVCLALMRSMPQSRIVASVYVCAVLEEEGLHNVSVSMPTGLQQCCIVTSVHFRAAPDEQQRHSSLAVLRCQAQRLIVPSAHVCVALDEKLHNSLVAPCCCQNHCSVTVSVHFRAKVKKQLHRLDVAVLGSKPQGCVHYTLVVLMGLKQRRAVLVHASIHHGADHCQVTMRSSTHQVRAALHQLISSKQWVVWYSCTGLWLAALAG